LTNIYLHFVSDLFNSEMKFKCTQLSGENIDKGGISIAELDIRK